MTSVLLDIEVRMNMSVAVGFKPKRYSF